MMLKILFKIPTSLFGGCIASTTSQINSWINSLIGTTLGTTLGTTPYGTGKNAQTERCTAYRYLSLSPISSLHPLIETAQKPNIRLSCESRNLVKPPNPPGFSAGNATYRGVFAQSLIVQQHRNTSINCIFPRLRCRKNWQITAPELFALLPSMAIICRFCRNKNRNKNWPRKNSD